MKTLIIFSKSSSLLNYRGELIDTHRFMGSVGMLSAWEAVFIIRMFSQMQNSLNWSRILLPVRCDLAERIDIMLITGEWLTRLLLKVQSPWVILNSSGQYSIISFSFLPEAWGRFAGHRAESFYYRERDGSAKNSNGAFKETGPWFEQGFEAKTSRWGSRNGVKAWKLILYFHLFSTRGFWTWMAGAIAVIGDEGIHLCLVLDETL